MNNFCFEPEKTIAKSMFLPNDRPWGALGDLGHHLGPKWSPRVLLVILGTILRGILYIHKLPINRKAADTCI